MKFTISTDQIIWFCSFVAGLWGMWKIVKETRKPNDDLKARVNVICFILLVVSVRVLLEVPVRS